MRSQGRALRHTWRLVARPLVFRRLRHCPPCAEMRQLYVLTALAKRNKFEEEEEALRAAVEWFAVTPPP